MQAQSDLGEQIQQVARELEEMLRQLNPEQENSPEAADQALHFQDSAAATESKNTPEQEYLQEWMAKHGRNGHLELSVESFDSREIPRLAMALKTDTTVKRLTLSRLPFDEAGVAAIAELIENNSSLKEIALIGNNLGPGGTRILAAALEKNATLQMLSLHANHVEDAGVTALAEALEKNVTLQDLTLDNDCTLTDTSAIALAKALSTNSTLLFLYLGTRADRSHEISDVGMAAIATMLKTNTSLRVLCLGPNWNYGVAGSIAIAEAMLINTTLEEMNHLRSYNKHADERSIKNALAALSRNTASRKEHSKHYNNTLPSKVQHALQQMPKEMLGIIQDYVGGEEAYPPRDSAPQTIMAATIRNTFDQLKVHIEAVITLMEKNPLYEPSSNKLQVVKMLQATLKTHVTLPEDDEVLIDNLPRYQYLLIHSIALASIIIGYNTKGSRAAQFALFFKAPKEATEIPLFNAWLQFQDPSLTLPVEVVTADLKAALATSIKELGVLDAQKPFKSLLERIRERTAQGDEGALVLFELIHLSSSVEQNLSAQALS